MSTPGTQEPVGLEPDRVSAWLEARLTEATPPFRFSPLTGGRSNLTYLVGDDRGRRVVLRRPPLGELAPTAHDVLREARVLDGLYGLVPVPKVLARCEDAEVTGAPFVVLEHIDGTVLRDPANARDLDAHRRGGVGPALVDVLLRLHAVDPDRLGLGHLAGRDDFAQRQLRRWHDNWRRHRIRELPDLERAHAWLTANLPRQRRSTVVHGDFRLDNCILDDSGAVRGVLDWELSTVGHPLADLGQLLVYWAEPDDEFTALREPPTRVPGFATREELRERYLAATDDDADQVRYFVAFNWWKVACIVEDVYVRTRRGAMGASDRTPESFADQARALAARACAEIATR